MFRSRLLISTQWLHDPLMHTLTLESGTTLDQINAAHIPQYTLKLPRNSLDVLQHQQSAPRVLS